MINRCMRLGTIAGLVAAVFLGAPPPAAAEVSDNFIRVLGRSVKFLSPAPSGTVPTAVVYAEGVAESRAQAERLQELIQASPSVGPVTLAPQLVSAEALAAASETQLVLLTEMPTEAQATAFEAASARNALTVGTTPTCVEAGHCAVSIETVPSIQIIVNESALQASGLRFDAAFMLLVDRV